ncbi:hypothetical protein [Haloferax larsenii]|uniref:hypothetical protein n=1 Tax=Haloferax larsenii TaxID=302484 RepID=UPI001481A64A|nr:hypothetical protein [Haloferax larsenii]
MLERTLILDGCRDSTDEHDVSTATLGRGWVEPLDTVDTTRPEQSAVYSAGG